MAKKKKEHQTFDRMADQKKSIPFPKVNQKGAAKAFQQRRTQGR